MSKARFQGENDFHCDNISVEGQGTKYSCKFDISFERGSELCDDYLPLSHSSPSDEMLGSGSTKNVMIRETFCNTRTFSGHKSQCAHAILC